MRAPLLHRLAGDDVLATRSGAGDDLAFAALVRRHQPRLHAYCAAILGDGGEADDAVQNAFIKALAGLRGGDAVGAVRPWLYRIAHNEAISLMRRRRPIGELVATVPDHAHGPAEAVAVREEVRALLHAIGDLPDRSRDALLLREVGGMRHAEVAQVLGTSPGNARQAVFEARLALQDDRAGRDASCQAVREEISARERRRASRAVRGHLRSCTSCKAWSDAQSQRRRVLGLAPGAAGVPLAGWLGGLLGGGASGGAAVKVVASVAAVATVAPVGIGALDRELQRRSGPPAAVAEVTVRTATTPERAPAATRQAEAPAPDPAPAAPTPAPAVVEPEEREGDATEPADRQGRDSTFRDEERERPARLQRPTRAVQPEEEQDVDVPQAERPVERRLAPPRIAGHVRDNSGPSPREDEGDDRGEGGREVEAEPERAPEPQAQEPPAQQPAPGPETTTEPAPVPAPETTTAPAPPPIDEGQIPFD